MHAGAVSMHSFNRRGINWNRFECLLDLYFDDVMLSVVVNLVKCYTYIVSTIRAYPNKGVCFHANRLIVIMAETSLALKVLFKPHWWCFFPFLSSILIFILLEHRNQQKKNNRAKWNFSTCYLRSTIILFLYHNCYFHKVLRCSPTIAFG